MRRYRGDRWAKAYGVAMIGELVEVVRYMARRRVLVRYEGRTVLTFTWCLARPEATS
ncbi:MAG: hypothetical protein HW375_13 [Anaerolineales bacterium]|nr:hypothetical protein [Anaerolineales bacterium]